MYYEFISLGCGKCNTTPLHCFPTKHTTMYTGSYNLLHYRPLAVGVVNDVMVDDRAHGSHIGGQLAH